MSIWNSIHFWKPKKDEIFIPYKPGYKPKPKKNNKEMKNENQHIWDNLKPLDLSKIETIQFPDDQYVKEIVEKKQCVIHHSVGGSVEGLVSEWLSTPERVGTCIAIDRTGIPWQFFSSRYWGYHLKCGKPELDKHSVAVEIINWGQLTYAGNGMYTTYYGNKIYTTVDYYPNKFRGYHYFEKYTIPQLITLGELLLYWNLVYKIPLDYNEKMWDLCPTAISGDPGVYTHISYRTDKSDCHPSLDLINMLKTLSGLVK